MTTIAKKRLKEFQRWLEPRLSDHGEYGHMADWAGKLVGHVARISGLLHAAELAEKSKRPWDEEIRFETMDKAIQMGMYLLYHARYIFQK